MTDYDANAGGMILGVGHGTMRDGPGWRTTIYFKGCNFRCAWCSSPDTFSGLREVMFFPDRVKYAGRLVGSCGRGAFYMVADGGVGTGGGETGVNGVVKGLVFDRSFCARCGGFDCAERCVDGSVEVAGREATVGELVAETMGYARAHEDYGVTLSGGEATLQRDFYLELLKSFKSHGLHTAVETNGSSERFAECFPWLDLAICDLKFVDEWEHEKWTGMGNEVVLRNIKAAAAEPGVELRVRIPVVPGVNDGENIDESIEFLKPMRDGLCVELLGYHRLGVYKWAALGKRYILDDVVCPDEVSMAELERRFAEAGLRVVRS